MKTTRAIGKMITSSSSTENHDILTALDFKCLAPFERITYSIQKIDSFIGCTKLSLKRLATSLARLKYALFVSISFKAAENVSFVILAKGNIKPCPFRSDLSAFPR